MSTQHESIPSHEQVLASFDQLVSIGAIKFSAPLVTKTTYQGFPFEFLVSYGQGKKELLGTDSNVSKAEDTENASTESQGFGPGSDIGYDGRLVIAHIRERHVLIFNLYPIVRPQLLLLTLDSYRKQHEALDQDDLASTYKVLETLSSGGPDYYAFFNCSKIGGASREHKHIQILPQEHTLFPDLPGYEPAIAPFQHFLARFDKLVEGGWSNDIITKYRGLLSVAMAALDVPADDLTCPHNVIMTREWLLVIPRRKSEFSARVPIPNAPSMMGSVWLANPDRLEEWQRLGPLAVLAHCGVPWPS